MPLVNLNIGHLDPKSDALPLRQSTVLFTIEKHIHLLY